MRISSAEFLEKFEKLNDKSPAERYSAALE